MTNRRFVLSIAAVLVTLTIFGTVFNSVLSAGYTRAAAPFFASLMKGNFAQIRQSLHLPTGVDPSVFADEKLAALRSAIGLDTDSVEVRFNRSEKVVSTEASEATPGGTTRVFFDLVSEGRYVEVETLIDDRDQRIQYVKPLGGPRPVPSLILFALAAVLALAVPVVNVVALVRIRSAFDRGRWWRYVTVLVCNLPTVSFLAEGSIPLNLLQNQMMLGYALDLAGLSHFAVSVGVPVGAVFWIVRLSRRARKSPGLA